MMEKGKGKSIKRLLREKYKKSQLKTHILFELYTFIGEQFQADLPLSAFPYPQTKEEIQKGLGQAQEIFIEINGDVLDLNRVWKPTKAILKLLLRKSRCLSDRLQRLSAIFQGIKSQIKFKTDSNLKIYPNESPVMQEIAARIEASLQ
jgi:hypothetical protein